MYIGKILDFFSVFFGKQQPDGFIADLLQVEIGIKEIFVRSDLRFLPGQVQKSAGTVRKTSAHDFANFRKSDQKTIAWIIFQIFFRQGFEFFRIFLKVFGRDGPASLSDLAVLPQGCTVKSRPSGSKHKAVSNPDMAILKVLTTAQWLLF